MGKSVKESIVFRGDYIFFVEALKAVGDVNTDYAIKNSCAAVVYLRFGQKFTSLIQDIRM